MARGNDQPAVPTGNPRHRSLAVAAALAALALTVAGVPAEAVVADYAATGERTEAIMARLRRSRLYSRDVNSKAADPQPPRAETMAAFLEQMDARYGGVASWLTDHGLSAADLAALRVKLRSDA